MIRYNIQIVQKAQRMLNENWNAQTEHAIFLRQHIKWSYIHSRDSYKANRSKEIICNVI